MNRSVPLSSYFTIVIIYQLLARVVCLENNTIKYTGSLKDGRSDVGPKKWITELFHDAETIFQIQPDSNADCRRDYDLYKLHLANQSVWAVRMKESSEWPSVGIFSGMVVHFGNYDECVKVSSYNIKGQYCLAEATYDYREVSLPENEFTLMADEKKSAWDAITLYRKNPVRVDRRKLQFAVCIPSSCTSTDLKISLNRTLYPLFKTNGLDVSVDVSPTSCNVRKEQPYSQGYFIVKWLFVGLFLLLISLTCCDVVINATNDDEAGKNKEKQRSLFMDLCDSVSIVSNFKKLKHVETETSYPMFHFAKVLNILIVIYGHRFIYSAGFPTFNTEEIEQHYLLINIELVHANVVDVFFAISGFLTFYFGFLPTLKGGGIYLFFSILFRWIRMVPVFGVLMLYIIFILPYSGEGPLWNQRVMNEVANCRDSWWTNLLAISNIINTDKQCLLVSWYISADIQLAIVGGFLLLILTKNKTIGICAIVFSYVAFTAITFAVAYINRYHGLLLLYMSLLKEPRNEKEFSEFYVATYTRGGPFILGMMAAYVVKILKDRKFTFTNKQIYVIMFVSLLITECSQFYGMVFYQLDRPFDRFESAFYAAVNRTLFLAVYAAGCCLYMTSGLGIFTKFVGWKGWVRFGRLTYSVFLINTVIQLYHASSHTQSQPVPVFARMSLVWYVFGDIIWSYIFGLALYLCVEAPIAGLSKILQQTLVRMFVKPEIIESMKNNSSTAEATDKKNENSNEIKSKGDDSILASFNKSFVTD